MSKSHPVDVHVGKRLRLRRSMLGMSQEMLGKAIGVTFQQIQKYERGINRIGSSRLYDFSRILSVPVSFFFDDFTSDNDDQAVEGFAEDNDNAFEATKDAAASKESISLVKAYCKIKDPDVRKKILSMVKAISDSSADDLTEN